KPAFFQEQRPLLRREGNDLRPATLPLERGTVYEGGNLHDFEAAIGVTGDRILYVGDHIYGDILRSKKESAWRTAMIIQEREAEVVGHGACGEQHKKSAELEERREELEDQLRYYQQRYKELTRKMDDDPAKSGNGQNGAPSTPASHVDAERGRAKRAVERIR